MIWEYEKLITDHCKLWTCFNRLERKPETAHISTNWSIVNPSMIHIFPTLVQRIGWSLSLWLVISRAKICSYKTDKPSNHICSKWDLLSLMFWRVWSSFYLSKNLIIFKFCPSKWIAISNEEFFLWKATFLSLIHPYIWWFYRWSVHFQLFVWPDNLLISPLSLCHSLFFPFLPFF